MIFPPSLRPLQCIVSVFVAFGVMLDSLLQITNFLAWIVFDIVWTDDPSFASQLCSIPYRASNSLFTGLSHPCVVATPATLWTITQPCRSVMTEGESFMCMVILLSCNCNYVPVQALVGGISPVFTPRGCKLLSHTAFRVCCKLVSVSFLHSIPFLEIVGQYNFCFDPGIVYSSMNSDVGFVQRFPYMFSFDLDIDQMDCFVWENSVGMS